MTNVLSILAFAFTLLFTSTSNAQVNNSLVLQPRIMAMGGAGVALADDQYALFNNPAGLAGQETRKFRLLGLGLEGSQDAYTELSTSFSTFKNFNISDLNKLMGQNIELRSSVVPMIQLPHFAITYLFDAQGGLNEFNLANPTFHLSDQITHGVQAGYGWSFKEGRKSTEEYRFGIAAKVLWRRGGSYDVSTAGFLEATSNSKQFVDQLVGNSYGMGIGADVGFQYINKIDKETKVFAGASVTDVGGTHFSIPQASDIPMNVSVGVGLEHKFDVGRLKFDADLRNLSQQTAFENMTHFGAEFSIAALDFQLGASQLNLTYGVAFDIWVLRVSALSYADELGYYFHQDVCRKYMLQVDFNLPI